MARKLLIEFRRDTAANWTAANPTLAAGEPGWESDTDKLKIGDGATAWNSLAYFAAGGSGTISDLTSSGGTLTVTNPTGPTTNVDLPATGVTPGSYGDGSHVPEITVDAEGRITALATTGVTGGSGTIGFLIGSASITAPVNIASTTEASGTTILSPGALTFDGGPVMVTFFAPFVKYPTAGSGANFVVVCLFEGATEIARIVDASYSSAGGAENVFMVGMYPFTPSAGSHSYTVTAFASSTTGTPQIGAGPGGTNAYGPAFVRFNKV